MKRLSAPKSRIPVIWDKESEIPIITPYVLENFSALWPADYQEKTVLDIGADRGSTASHFLRNGARFVICVEGDPMRFRELEANLPLLRNAKAVFKWISSPSDMTELLCNFADIVKIDVEGAERHLLGVEPYIIRQHPEYMVEVHKNVISLDSIINLFRQCGFDVIMGTQGFFAWQIIHCRIRSIEQKWVNLDT